MKNDQIPGSNKIALKIKTSQARQQARSKGPKKPKILWTTIIIRRKLEKKLFLADWWSDVQQCGHRRGIGWASNTTDRPQASPTYVFTIVRPRPMYYDLLGVVLWNVTELSPSFQGFYAWHPFKRDAIKVRNAFDEESSFGSSNFSHVVGTFLLLM